jgi:hypothetical protein
VMVDEWGDPGNFFSYAIDDGIGFGKPSPK